PQAMVNGTTTRSPTFSFSGLIPPPTSTTSPMNSWPRMSPCSMVGIKPSYRCRSEPQMQVLVIFTIASRGFRMVGSGTFSTLIFSLPIQQTAFMTLSFASPSFEVFATGPEQADQDQSLAPRRLICFLGRVTDLPLWGSLRFQSALSDGAGPGA